MNCRLKNAYIKIDDRKFNVLSTTNCEKNKKNTSFCFENIENYARIYSRSFA